ncbi:MAG: hypothetical protein E7398_00185 [Ruminococcaceae bacterium]|nr:hypothetical protein [Oscillospiraceae bacterium]
MIENEMNFISEQLDHIRAGLRDYSIGAYNRNIIIVSDALKFLDGLEELQKNYCTLPDDMSDEIKRVLDARDRFRSIDMSYNNLYNLSVWLDQKAQYFADCITDYFSSCLDPSRVDMISYFIEFYADERMDESYYINDGILYQTITKKIA